MRLDIKNLVYKPKYFQEKPITLLHFIMQDWSGQLYPLNEAAVVQMRKIYTNCQCKSSNLIWQKTIVENQEVEVIACYGCDNWSLIMSSENEKNGFQEEPKRACLCQGDVSPSVNTHSPVRDEFGSARKGRGVRMTGKEGWSIIAREKFQAINETIRFYQSMNMVRYLYAVAKVHSYGYYRWLQNMSF